MLGRFNDLIEFRRDGRGSEAVVRWVSLVGGVRWLVGDFSLLAILRVEMFRWCLRKQRSQSVKSIIIYWCVSIAGNRQGQKFLE